MLLNRVNEINARTFNIRFSSLYFSFYKLFLTQIAKTKRTSEQTIDDLRLRLNEALQQLSDIEDIQLKTAEIGESSFKVSYFKVDLIWNSVNMIFFTEV